LAKCSDRRLDIAIRSGFASVDASVGILQTKAI